MAKRFIIFDAAGNARLAIDWRHDRNRIEGLLQANMQDGEVAVEVTPSGDESLQMLLTNVHRCRATLRGGKLEDIQFLQSDEHGQITARTRLLQPDQLIATIARYQYTRHSGVLNRSSRKQP